MWRPGLEALAERVRQLPATFVRVPTPESLAASLQLRDDVVAAIPDDLKPASRRDGSRGRVHSAHVRPSWDTFRRPVNRYVAAKAFASWTAYQGGASRPSCEASTQRSRSSASRAHASAAMHGGPGSGSPARGISQRRFRAQSPGGRRGSRALSGRKQKRLSVPQGPPSGRHGDQRSRRPVRGRSCPTPAAPRRTWPATASDVAGEDVVQPPADVPLPHVAPRRPPREQVGVVRLESRDGRPRGRGSGCARSARVPPGAGRSMFGRRSLGWTSMSVRATLRSPHRTRGRPAAWSSAEKASRPPGIASLPGSPCRRWGRKSTRR